MKIGELSHYGLIDFEYNTIVPKQSQLKFGPTGKGSLNFVTNAFQGVMNHFNKAYSLERINLKDNILARLSAKRGYEDPINMYNIYVDELFMAYADHFVNYNKIRSIDEYMDNLIPFMKKMKAPYPLNFSSWVKSTKGSPFVSGLYLDVANIRLDDDNEKSDKMINNPNINFFLNTCKAHGFYVSHQFPSVLVADIASAPMRSYMSQFHNMTGGFQKNFFDIYYDKAHERDIEILTNNIIKYYTMFINKYALIVNPKTDRLNKTYVDVFYRPQDINYNINIDKIINIYTIIKNIEEDYPFGDTDIQQFIKNAIKIKNNLDKISWVDYINLQFTSVYVNKYGNINYHKERFKAFKALEG